MKILFIHAVGQWGGSSRSLFELIRNFPKGTVEPYFLTSYGTSTNFFKIISKNIICVKGLSRFDNTQYSYYKGLRWLIVLREIFFLPHTFFALLKAKKAFKDIELIHINDFVAIVPLILSKIIFRVPIVVHVRSVSRLNFKSNRTKLVTFILNKFSDQIICIDETVKQSLDPRLKSLVIHNSFSKEVKTNEDLIFKNKISKIDPKAFKIGFVGAIHKSKGIFELLNAYEIVYSKGFRPQLIFVGGEPLSSSNFFYKILNKLGLRQFVLDELKSFIRKSKMKNNIKLLGYTEDIKAAYSSMDVICMPGLLNAPGRQIIEAAFFKVPVILAISNPKKDTIIHNKTGLVVPLNDPKELAKAIIFSINNINKIKKMGENAYELAKKNFDPVQNSLKVCNLYKKVLSIN